MHARARVCFSGVWKSLKKILRVPNGQGSFTPQRRRLKYEYIHINVCACVLCQRESKAEQDKERKERAIDKDNVGERREKE